MSKKMTLWLGWPLLLAVLAACGQVNNDGTTTPGGTGSSTGTSTGSTTGTASNPPPNVVDNSAGFYARYYRSNNYTYYDHAAVIQDSSGTQTVPPSTTCTATAGQKVYCFIEAQELDLYYNGVGIQYNVPSTMCSYIRWTPYWYYFLQPGVGPSTVYRDTDKNGVVGYDHNSDGVINPATSDPLDAVAAPCPYDYSASSPPGPNCCEGGYTAYSRIWSTTTNSYGPTSETTGAWGGQGSSCVSGPGKDLGPLAKNNYPETVYTYVQGTGINQLYSVPAPLEKTNNTVGGAGPNIYEEYAATYYTNVENGASPPTPLAPPGGYPSSPYYDIQCLDRSHEFVAEIIMIVRKWNTSSAFTNFLTNPNGFNLTGTEGSPWASAPLDDAFSWVELGNTFPGMGN